MHGELLERMGFPDASFRDVHKVACFGSEFFSINIVIRHAVYHERQIMKIDFRFLDRPLGKASAVNEQKNIRNKMGMMLDFQGHRLL